MKKKKTLHLAFLATVPVMAGYVVLGIAFGILLVDKGYSFWLALLMSLMVYAGSMQFVAVDLLTGGASLISAALVTLMVNARHLFYGVSMLTRYRGMGKIKPYLIFGLTDETFALVCNDVPEGLNKKLYYTTVTLLDQCYWVLGSVIGAVIGSVLPFRTDGIDFAMTALFVTIFTEQILTAKDYVPAVTGVIVSVLCLLIFGPSRFLIPAMVGIAAVLLVYGILRKKVGKE